MFHEEDLRLDIEDFKIAVVHNGTDHYVGTKLVQKNFNDGILSYSNYLQEVQVIGDLLLQCTKDETVTSIISKCNNIVKLADTELVKLFTHTEKEKDPEEHAEATGVEREEGGGTSNTKKEEGQVRNYTEAQFMDKITLYLWHNKSHRGRSFPSQNKKAY